MMKIILCFIFLTTYAYSSAAFNVDSSLLDKLFKKSLQSIEKPSPTLAYNLNLGVAEFIPKKWILKNKYYITQYNENFLFLNLSIESKNLFLNSGYGFKQGLYNVYSTVGSKHTNAMLLTYTPLQMGLKNELLSTSTFKLESKMGAGIYFLNQRGTLDGISQNFVLPHALIGMLLHIKPILLEAFYQKAFHKEQKIEGITFSLSMSINLNAASSWSF